MIQEPETLYKLMILYMLKEVHFPLTNSQLSQFFLDKEYTTYFTLQHVLLELTGDNLIVSRRSGSVTRYEITQGGMQTLEFFGKDISAAAVADMDTYLQENKFRLRSEAATTSEYYKVDSLNYSIRCEVREGKNTLIGLDLSVPDEKQAERICAAWREKSQDIYSYIIRKLSE
ncbi:MAG: DUF4364 family protein [Eubacteriales bacterium]|nr:DUF4364 family protein [Eubacteriales bacterium]